MSSAADKKQRLLELLNAKAKLRAQTTPNTENKEKVVTAPGTGRAHLTPYFQQTRSPYVIDFNRDLEAKSLAQHFVTPVRKNKRSHSHSDTPTNSLDHTATKTKAEETLNKKPAKSPRVKSKHQAQDVESDDETELISADDDVEDANNNTTTQSSASEDSEDSEEDESTKEDTGEESEEDRLQDDRGTLHSTRRSRNKTEDEEASASEGDQDEDEEEEDEEEEEEEDSIMAEDDSENDNIVEEEEEEEEELEASDAEAEERETSTGIPESDEQRVESRTPLVQTSAVAAAPVKVPALPWMRAPVEGGHAVLPLEDVRPRLDLRVEAALRRQGIHHLFPVQACVWRETGGGVSGRHDLCICAPTGSGKTLAYALPLAQGLAGRVIRRVRGLVVLPTHDLAHQVAGVVRGVCAAAGLSVGVVAGKGSLAPEASRLVGPSGESLVDVLVATPGRLMAHMRHTQGMSLQHLRYLVVDETDRMLRQAYQDWLPHVLQAAGPSMQESVAASPPLDSVGVSNSAALDFSVGASVRAVRWERGDRTETPRLQKLLLSATLTQDPSKISRLSLHAPRMLVVKSLPTLPTQPPVGPSSGSGSSPHSPTHDIQQQQPTGTSGLRYSLPLSLASFKVECSVETRPLVLLALLDQHLRGLSTICFTASVEATHRLFMLLSSVHQLPFRVVEYSSHQSQAERTAALESFKSSQRLREGTLLIASDAITRGMDLQEVDAVVNYDSPVYAKTFVHRVGRTARAGRRGRCFTLLRPDQERHFKKLLGKVENSSTTKQPVQRDTLQAWLPKYQAALAAVKRQLTAEKFNAKHSGADGAERAAEKIASAQAARNFRAMYENSIVA